MAVAVKWPATRITLSLWRLMWCSQKKYRYIVAMLTVPNHLVRLLVRESFGIENDECDALLWTTDRIMSYNAALPCLRLFKHSFINNIMRIHHHCFVFLQWNNDIERKFGSSDEPHTKLCKDL